MDGHRLSVDGLATLLKPQAGMAVLGKAGSVAEALPKIEDLSPDIVLVDFHLPDGTVVDVGRALHDLRPGARLIVVTEGDSDSARFAAVSAGAVALLQKSHVGADLVDAIRRAAAGEVLITPQSVASILTRHREIEARSGLITQRELEVLELLAQGRSSREIASRLGVTYATVRAHIYHLGKKLGARSKLELVAKARSDGLI